MKILRYLVEVGVNFNKKDNYGCIIFSWVCFKGRVEMVRYLLNDFFCIDFWVDVIDKEGNNVLFFFVMFGNFYIVKIMVEVLKDIVCVSEINKVNNDGMWFLIVVFLCGD